MLEEPDERFELTVRGTRSGDVVLLRSESRDTGESWALDAHAPESPPSARSAGGGRAWSTGPSTSARATTCCW